MRREYFAPCTLGLEEVVAAEVRELGGGDVTVRRGAVSFTGDRRVGYAANLWLRSAVRVQERVAEFRAKGRKELEEGVGAIEWERWLAPGGTLAVDASVRDSEIGHSGFAALAVKDAIVDRFRGRTGARPSVDAKDPDLPVKLVLHKDRATLDLNLSGESLHKRGWRPIQVKSPVNEAIAAGLLILSGWDRRTPLADPMCGSGTIVVEAALLAADRAPGLLRRFAFERWLDFEEPLWNELKEEARQRARPSLDFPIEGADRHEGALGLARRGVRAAGVEGLVSLRRCELKEFTPTRTPATLFTNPPWGERLGEGADLVESWRDLGDLLRKSFAGSTAFILTGDAELPLHLGYKPRLEWPFMSGPIECRLQRYDLYPRFATRRPGEAGEAGESGDTSERRDR
jgi:putative N6-adenine-specific DNA methylase